MFENIFRRYLEHISEKYGATEFSEKTVHVHQLVRCKHKSALETLFNFVPSFITPGIFIGELVDIAMKKLLEDLGFKTEIEITKQVEINGHKIDLIGRPDALSECCVVEIKYSKVRPESPFEHHLLQLKLYLYLTDKEEGYLIYITPEGFAEFKINEKPDKTFIEELFNNWKSPRFEWECNYCLFRKICPFSHAYKEYNAQSRQA